MLKSLFCLFLGKSLRKSLCFFPFVSECPNARVEHVGSTNVISPVGAGLRFQTQARLFLHYQTHMRLSHFGNQTLVKYIAFVVQLPNTCASGALFFEYQTQKNMKQTHFPHIRVWFTLTSQTYTRLLSLSPNTWRFAVSFTIHMRVCCVYIHKHKPVCCMRNQTHTRLAN